MPASKPFWGRILSDSLSPPSLLVGGRGSIARARWRSPFIGGLLVALAIMITATASTTIMAVIVHRVLLDDLRNYLKRSAETTAAMIDGQRVVTFTDSLQTGTNEYLAVAAPLITLLATNPDIRFAYSGTMHGDTSLFILDGDTTSERAWVGEQDAPTAGELKLARTRHTVVESAPSPTAWGTGIRAYAPIRTPRGSPVYYVGITMDARRYEAWLRRVYYASAAGLAVAFLLAVLGGMRAAATEAARLEADAEIARSRQREAMAAEERRALELRLERRQR